LLDLTAPINFPGREKEGLKLGTDSVINEELKDLINVEFGPVVYHVEKWWLKKFAEAIDDPNPNWGEVAPPTFTTALRLEDLFNAIHKTKCPLERSVNGGNEMEYFLPMLLGDIITVTGRIVGMRKREGRLGGMLIIDSEETYTNQQGELVAKCRNTNIRY